MTGISVIRLFLKLIIKKITEPIFFSCNLDYYEYNLNKYYGLLPSPAILHYYGTDAVLTCIMPAHGLYKLNMEAILCLYPSRR